MQCAEWQNIKDFQEVTFLCSKFTE